MSSEHVLVTGGQGFFGAWIIKQLLDEGSKVSLFDLQEDLHILLQVLSSEQIQRINRVYGDVSDTKMVVETVCSIKPTAIIHLAGLQIPTCRTNPVLGAKVNVIGTLSVFEAVKQLSGVEKKPVVVYASSAAVCGRQEEYQTTPIEDDVFHKPHTHYGIFKLANEGNARIFWEEDGISSVGLRPLTCYGVGREIGVTSAPTKAIKAAVLCKEEFYISFTGSTGFSYVKDVAKVFIACARAKFEGARVFNIRGTVATVEDFVTNLQKVLPQNKTRIRMGSNAIPIAFDTSEEELQKFIPHVDFNTPLDVAIQEIVDHFVELKKRKLLTDHDLVSTQ